jgi:predicted nucleic acid-binding protein
MSDDATYLFDASAIIELLYEGDAIAHLFGEATTDLATYEVTNVVFTASAKRQQYPRDRAEEYIELFERVRSEMTVLPTENLPATDIYELCWETSLPAYDSSYILAARTDDRTLVARDDGIHDHAPSDVDVIEPTALVE